MPKSAPVETAPAWDLYIRDHCGLCDQALAVLAAFGFPAFRMIWIDDDPVLEACYGARIPVLSHRDGGAALDWPFEADALQRLRERARD